MSEHEAISPEEIVRPPQKSDEELKQEAKDESKALAFKKAYQYYLVFSQGDGAAVLEDMYQAYMERRSLDLDNPDPYLMAYCEGQRSVVLEIMALMKLGAHNPQ